MLSIIFSPEEKLLLLPGALLIHRNGVDESGGQFAFLWL